MFPVDILLLHFSYTFSSVQYILSPVFYLVNFYLSFRIHLKSPLLCDFVLDSLRKILFSWVLLPPFVVIALQYRGIQASNSVCIAAPC